MIDNVSMLSVPLETLEPEPLILKGRVDMYIDFEIDVRALRNEMGEKAWAEYSIEGGYHEWERAAVIIHDVIADNTDFDLYGPKYIKTTWADIDEIELSPRWNKQLAEQLDLFPKDDAATVEKAAN